MDSDCSDCAPQRFDDTFEGFGNDDAPWSAALDGIAAKVRMRTPAVAVDDLAWLYAASPSGLFVAIPVSLAGLGGQSPSVNAQPVNGNFGFWQSGDGPFTVDGYTADQWQLANGSGATNAITREDHTPGVWPKGRNYAKWNRTVAGVTPSKYANIVEDVRSYAGQTITCSWSLSASVAMTLLPYIEQHFGSAGSASVVTLADGVDIDTDETRVSVTFEVPSVAGKTIGAGEDSSIRIGFQREAGQPNGELNLWAFSVDVGDSASEFPYQDPAVEEEKCQRHLFVGHLVDFAGGAYSTTQVTLARTLPVDQRTTALVSTPAFTNAVYLPGTGLATPTGFLTSWQNHGSLRIVFTGLTGLTVGQPASGGDGTIVLDARIPL